MSYVLLLLLFILPAIVPPLLFALIARGGGVGQRRMLFILLIANLVFFVPFFLLLGTPFFSMVGGYYAPNNSLFWSWAFDWGVCYTITILLGTLLSLTIAARGHKWGWFGVLLITALISSVAGVYAYGSASAYGAPGLDVLLDTRGDMMRGYMIYQSPLYHLIIWALAGLTVLAQALYILLGLRASAANGLGSGVADALQAS